MANATQTALGRANLSTGTGYGGSGDKYELYLKLFSGEMFKGFQHNTIARDLVMKRTLKSGKSLQFIYTGRMDASFHTPGTPILGSGDPPVAEKTIVVDDLLVSSAFVYDLDETLSHYELRGEISRKIGYALAEHYDRRIFRAITRGARAAHPVSATGKVEPGGTQIQVGTGTGTTADALDSDKIVAAFFDAAAVLDEKGLSQDGRCAVLSPRQYYSLVENVSSNALINRDVQGDALQDGNGIMSIAGIKIYKSMNIPFLGNYGTKYDSTATNDLDPGVTDPGRTGDFVSEVMEDARNSVTGINNDYGDRTNFGGAPGTGLNTTTGNASVGSCGLIFQREGAGVVEAMGPQVQVTNGDVSVVYQGK